jgi:hypothetical protein
MPRKTARPSTLPACPRCRRADRVAPVAYGLPSDMRAIQDAGYVIGGCEPGLPFDCARCAIRFDESGATEPGTPVEWRELTERHRADG